MMGICKASILLALKNMNLIHKLEACVTAIARQLEIILKHSDSIL